MFGRDRIYTRKFVLFFQAEDGIRDAQESRGLGDVYKRQVIDPETAMIAKLKSMTPNEQVAYLKELAMKAEKA